MLLMPNFLENAVKPKFGELYFLVSFHVSFHVSWANREKRNAGRSRRGEIRSVRRFPGPIVLPSGSRTHTANA
jgi:hypothetical protein